MAKNKYVVIDSTKAGLVCANFQADDFMLVSDTAPLFKFFNGQAGIGQTREFVAMINLAPGQYIKEVK